MVGARRNLVGRAAAVEASEREALFSSRAPARDAALDGAPDARHDGAHHTQVRLRQSAAHDADAQQPAADAGPTRDRPSFLDPESLPPP